MMILFFIAMIVAFFWGTFSEARGLWLGDCLLASVLLFTVGILIAPLIYPKAEYSFLYPILLILYIALVAVYFVIGWLIGDSFLEQSW